MSQEGIFTQSPQEFVQETVNGSVGGVEALQEMLSQVDPLVAGLIMAIIAGAGLGGLNTALGNGRFGPQATKEFITNKSQK